MAKTKAELEADRDRHHELMAESRAALKRNDYQVAIHAAVSAWQHVDGMMQYDRRWGSKSEFDTIDSIALVLRYAPLVFDIVSLEELSTLLTTQRRIDRNTAADLAADLEAAQETMWNAHRLWTELEAKGELRQDELRRLFGGSQERWRWIAESWERMGALQRKPEGGSYRLSLATRLDVPARCKCSSCGVRGQAPKIQLLEEIRCPKCEVTGYFVLLLA